MFKKGNLYTNSLQVNIKLAFKIVLLRVSMSFIFISSNLSRILMSKQNSNHFYTLFLYKS